MASGGVTRKRPDEASTLPEVSGERLIEMFRTMMTIRRFEECVIRLAEGNAIGHFHVYIGQEVTGVVALSFMGAGDLAFTTHRNHGHLLARGADSGRMLAEILGRKAGYNKGKGGTLHISAPELGFPVTSAVTGGCIPLATGAAFGFKRRGMDRVSVCLTGDGSLEEGAWHESVNIAALERLPVIFLIENNSLEAVGQVANEYPSSTIAAEQLIDLAAAFRVPRESIDGADAAAVYRVMNEAVERARDGGGPSFIEAQTVRWPGSRGLWPELVTGETELSSAWEPTACAGAHVEWQESQDGLLRFARQLIPTHLSVSSAIEIDAEVRVGMEDAVRFAMESPYPEPEAAMEDVFA